jgi:hypothetical protein
MFQGSGVAGASVKHDEATREIRGQKIEHEGTQDRRIIIELSESGGDSLFVV